MDAEKTEQPVVWLADGEECVPLEKALAIMTDDWLDAGNDCTQTVIDLRDACLWLVGRAAAAELEKARHERGTRAVQRVDGRAARTEDAEERTRWVVAVAHHGEDTATEYPAGDDKEAAYRQATILRDVLQKRNARAVVAVAEVAERRVTVMELETGSPTD